ncbi:MAG: CBS domain-containing protein [Candidatus Helarchaeota archaeon]|nr:CBS domain-containing protein [Candidatus Helarchaeota archaeon]
MSVSDLKARDLMLIDIVYVRPDEKVAAVDLLMVRKSLGGVPILEYKTDKLVGIVTQRDIMLSRFRTSIAGMSVSNLMTKNPITVAPNASIKEILNLMLSHHIERLPVIDNDKLIGIIEPESILYAVHKKISSKE